jgi:hypothetical protein
MGADDSLCLWRAYNEEDNHTYKVDEELLVNENLLQRIHCETPT